MLVEVVIASACVIRRNGRVGDSNDGFILRVLSPASRVVVDDGADEVVGVVEGVVEADGGSSPSRLVPRTVADCPALLRTVARQMPNASPSAAMALDGQL